MSSTSLKVAVTGGSGRVGHTVLKTLVARGHHAINLDRMPPRREVPGVRFVCVDLRRREIVQPYIEGMDAVIHLGEIPSSELPYPQEEIYASNTAAGATVLETAADMKVKRFIYTSSCQVYGFFGRPTVLPLHLPMDETHPVQPQNAYAVSKVANEYYARFIAQHRGLSIAIFRLPWVMQDELHPRWIRRMARREPWLDGLGAFIHVDDVAEVYALALENPRPGCETYQVTGDDVITLDPIREVMMRAQPDCPPLPADWPDFKSPALADKAKAHFNWQPKWSFQEQLAKNPDLAPLQKR